MEWSTLNSLQLIDEYKKYPYLWNSKHPLYSSKIDKSQAWYKIAYSLNVEMHEAKTKMHSLLGSFRREKAKGRKSFQTENGQTEMYVSKWFAFKKMQFLLEKGVVRGSDDTDNDLEQSKMPIISMQNEMNDRSSSHSLDVPERPIAITEKKKKRKKPPVHQEEFNRKNQKILATIPNTYNNEPDEDTEFMKALKSINEDFQQSRDEYALFGEHVSYQIRKLNNPRLQALAKHRISTVLYEVELKGIDEQNYTDPMQMK